jgi:hypothetical protein
VRAEVQLQPTRPRRAVGPGLRRLIPVVHPKW